jgi:hypothetical protein
MTISPQEALAQIPISRIDGLKDALMLRDGSAKGPLGWLFCANAEDIQRNVFARDNNKFGTPEF